MLLDIKTEKMVLSEYMFCWGVIHDESNTRNTELSMVEFLCDTWKLNFLEKSLCVCVCVCVCVCECACACACACVHLCVHVHVPGKFIHLHVIVFVNSYLYSGEVVLSTTSVLPLLLLADKYEVSCLRQSCLRFMMDHVVQSPDTNRALTWYQYAQVGTRYHSNGLEWQYSHLVYFTAYFKGDEWHVCDFVRVSVWMLDHSFFVNVLE